MEHDDRLALRHAMVDLVRIDGHASHSEGRTPRIAHELRDADEGARRRVRRRLHDCAKEGGGEDKERVTQDAVVSFGVLGHLWRTAGYHEVCAADEDGYDGGGRGEDRE